MGHNCDIKGDDIKFAFWYEIITKMQFYFVHCSTLNN